MKIVESIKELRKTVLKSILTLPCRTKKKKKKKVTTDHKESIFLFFFFKVEVP